MLGPRMLVLAACLCGLACKKQRATPPPPDPERSVNESLFIIAHPHMTRAPLPARFAGPLPASVRELASDAYPPLPFIRAAVRADKVDMRRRLVEAITRATAAGPLPKELADWYTWALGYVPDEATCQWLVTTASSDIEARARAALWNISAHCQHADVASLVERDGLPDDVIVEWIFNSALDLPYSERAARAASEVARSSRDDYQLRKVGFVFARMAGERSIAALTALQKSVADSKRRALVGLGMLRGTSQAARAIGESSCKHPEVARDAMCRPADSPGVARARTDLAGMIEDGTDAATLVASFPRTQVLAALVACVRSETDYRRTRCFDRIADLDRPTAVSLAKDLVGDSEGRVARTARSLLAFPDVASIDKELARLGFSLDHKPRRSDDGPLLAVEDVLFARGRAMSFDAETGRFPNEHDGLLAELAALVAPVLDDVVFDEISPSESDAAEDRGTYRLHAYADGKRFAVDAENRGDWYDVEAVIGLVNALLVARHSELRLALLPTGGQDVTVLAGPRAGIQSLVEARLIEIEHPSEAERVGKEFENRVFEQLRDGRQVVPRQPHQP